MQGGDVIGPWVFADLQAALNALVWPILRNTIWGNKGENNLRYGWGNSRDGDTPPNDFPSAKALAVSYYTGAVVDDTPGPHAHSLLSNHDAGGVCGVPRGNGDPQGIHAYAELERSYAYQRWTSPVAWTKDIELYVLCDWDQTEFDGNGDWGTGYAVGHFRKWATLEAATGYSGYSEKFGSLTTPNSWPGVPAYGCVAAQGYAVSESFAVFKYNRTGGYTYY
jgi:hypothetical protein